MVRARPLTVKLLESRLAPAAFGVPWPEPDALTLSFAPDGTVAGNQASSLFRTLDARLSTQDWQVEILRAFQTWAVEADINIGLVPDSGQPFGTLGLKQHDPRFGDIRIGAYPMGSDVLAVADPYDPFVANTWVGDVFLNSAYQFDLTGGTSSYHLFSVLLHEAGHVLGLDHSPDPNSAMYEQFHPITSGLTAGDIAALRGLYGARPADAFEGWAGNDTFATATPLSLAGANGQPASASIQADITTATDADIYRLAVPEGATGLDLRLHAEGLSLLVPRLTIYDATGHEVATAAASDPRANDLTVHLAGAHAGAVYYVRVEGATHDVFGMGSYELDVAPQPVWATTGGHGQNNSWTNNSGASQELGGITLLATTPGYVEHTYYEALGNLTPPAPVHTYRVRSADLGPDLTNVMTVVVRSENDSWARFQVNVLDDHGNPVDARVLVNTPGIYTIQIPSVLSNRDYFVQVASATATSYEIEVDFAQDASHLELFATDTLSANQAAVVKVLQVVQSQQIHFLLSATDWSQPQATGIRMTVYNADGQAVFTLAVEDGATRTGDLFLDPGRYTVRFTRAHEGAGALLPVFFKLAGMSLSEPLGPQLRDTVLRPVDSANLSSVAALSFYWLPFSLVLPATGSGQPTPQLDSLAASQLLTGLNPNFVATLVTPGQTIGMLPNVVGHTGLPDFATWVSQRTTAVRGPGAGGGDAAELSASAAGYATPYSGRPGTDDLGAVWSLRSIAFVPDFTGPDTDGNPLPGPTVPSSLSKESGNPDAGGDRAQGKAPDDAVAMAAGSSTPFTRGKLAHVGSELCALALAALFLNWCFLPTRVASPVFGIASRLLRARSNRC